MTDKKSALQTAQERLSSIASALTGASTPTFPAFDALARVPGQPQGCLWGHFDEAGGKKDEVGTLNLLTPDVVKAASREISTGERIQLDWPLENVQFPGFGRKEFNQKVIDLASLGFSALDDEIYINTQSGSQWDSLKHFAHQKSGMYYNGLSHQEATKSITNGIHSERSLSSLLHPLLFLLPLSLPFSSLLSKQHRPENRANETLPIDWCERGGIVGRGVLVDWLRWYEAKHGTPPSPVSRHEIPVSELEQTLQWQGTTTRPGDIMLIRSGYVRWHKCVSHPHTHAHTQHPSPYLTIADMFTARNSFAGTEERKRGTQQNSVAIGMQANEASVRWLYDHHFAAVGGDTVAFEAWPPRFDEGWCLHEWLLVQWGTPIGMSFFLLSFFVFHVPPADHPVSRAGEMWDLETLSKKCEALNRWTFFLTSAPLHVKGGVGSPPGAIAIF